MYSGRRRRQIHVENATQMGARAEIEINIESPNDPERQVEETHVDRWSRKAPTLRLRELREFE